MTDFNVDPEGDDTAEGTIGPAGSDAPNEVVQAPSDFLETDSATPAAGIPEEFFEESADTSEEESEQEPLQTPPGGKTVGEVALEVIEGKWGTGQRRRLALSKAGYDPNEVREAVVALMNKD